MKLDLILENVKNKYTMGLLEESEGMAEKDVLAGKILINESIMQVRKMLVEEGTIVAVQDLLQESWADHIAGGAQGLAHGVAGVAGLATGDAEDGSMDLDYGDAGQAINSSMQQGYSQGYNPELNVGQTASIGNAIGANPGTAAAIGAGVLAGGVGAGMVANRAIPVAGAALKRRTQQFRNRGPVRPQAQPAQVQPQRR